MKLDLPKTQVPMEQLVRGLGYFSIGLGLAELLAPRQVSRGAGMHRQDYSFAGVRPSRNRNRNRHPHRKQSAALAVGSRRRGRPRRGNRCSHRGWPQTRPSRFVLRSAARRRTLGSVLRHPICPATRRATSWLEPRLQQAERLPPRD